jgi:hypothetical protein
VGTVHLERIACDILPQRHQVSFLPEPGFDVQLNLLYLAMTMVATLFLGVLVFKAAMYKARRDGLIDKKEEY